MNKAQKEAYKRDYAIAKEQGKSFFPYAIYKDMIVATFVIALIIFLAIWAKVEVGPVIDPTTETYVPRPEWYYFFVFELLRIFKGQNAFMPVIMATFVIPNVLIGILFLWPFVDRGPERRIWKRPVSMAVGLAVIWFLCYTTWKGATTPEGGGSLTISVPSSDTEAAAGMKLVEQAGCLSCHNIGGVGGAVGPNLTDHGTKTKGIDFEIKHLKDPQSTSPGSIMPSFGAMTDQQLTEIATFITGLGTKYK